MVSCGLESFIRDDAHAICTQTVMLPVAWLDSVYWKSDAWAFVMDGLLQAASHTICCPESPNGVTQKLDVLKLYIRFLHFPCYHRGFAKTSKSILDPGLGYVQLDILIQMRDAGQCSITFLLETALRERGVPQGDMLKSQRERKCTHSERNHPRMAVSGGCTKPACLD